MSVLHGLHPAVIELLTAWGIYKEPDESGHLTTMAKGDKGINRVTLNMRPDDVVTLTVTYTMDEESFKKALPILKRYQLSEIDSGWNTPPDPAKDIMDALLPMPNVTVPPPPAGAKTEEED